MKRDLSHLARHAFSRKELEAITSKATTEFEKQKILDWAAKLMIEYTTLQQVLLGKTAVNWDKQSNEPYFTKL